MSSFLEHQGRGSGVALPEMLQPGHSWPENLIETPEKWHLRHWLSSIPNYSEPYE